MPNHPITSTQNEFIPRHIGPNQTEVHAMLSELGFSQLEELIQHVVPKPIRSQEALHLGEGPSEYHATKKLAAMMEKNKVFKSYLGQGFHDTLTPTIIQRNILENPVWYTAYTPYQAEIAQGRLEALLNYQTMIADLTGLEIANASLLDEGTANAEAMTMAHSLSKTKSDKFVVSPDMHPHVLEVLKTRSQAVGLQMVVQNPAEYDFSSAVFAVFLQYPSTHGVIHDVKALAEKAHQHGAMVIASCDLLSLTLLQAPGEWGADIAVGNSQRFGVPMGFGGPHAAFMSTKDQYKRSMPGRLVGISVDSQGQSALRLALQTREQHIRREKATSNICTAQVLLANMASMYAVYHGPAGLKKMALRIHKLTQALAAGLERVGLKVSSHHFFDTVSVRTNEAQKIYDRALQHKINLWKVDDQHLCVSLNETTTHEDVNELLHIFSQGAALGFSVSSLITAADELNIPNHLIRTSKYLQHSVFNSHHSETKMLRYIHSLQNKDVTLTHSMIPLGSCTMKLNATSELAPVSWEKVGRVHPFVPLDQAAGYLEMFQDLEKKLCDITGFAGISLQPNAGSQGEYAGLLVIEKYHQSRGESHRRICLIPASAHGTNPASAAMVNMQVVVVPCDEQGNVDVAALRQKAEEHAKNLAALMITYPSTHGVFEESIQEICQIIHKNGGQVYMDGANMNALVGLCKPGAFGPDVLHMNLHKTFAIPHGGGGPGVGPIGVAKHLVEYLPGPCNDGHLRKDSISSVTSARWGSASILPISWMYIEMMGSSGLKLATEVAILNANYIAKKLSAFYPVLYKGKEGLVAHECILDLRPLKKTSGIDVNDVAKRLMDYGFHAPTMSFPVPGTLMVEPTESESKAELDRFIQAMIQIRQEIDRVEKGQWTLEDNPLVHAPHTMAVITADEWNHKYTRQEAAFPLPWLTGNKLWPAVGRVDNAHGDRHLICSCPPVESYQA